MSHYYRYIILGAGPSGLTMAHALIARGIPQDSILVLEKESVAGGLCRSVTVDGSPLDIGGGHFLDERRKDVTDFLFRFMPAHEWQVFDRIAKIRIAGVEVDHPLEANLWQLSKEDQLDFLESITRAGCVRGDPMPEAFDEWVLWKFGECISERYMLPYNRKIWSLPLSELGTYWLHKLPDVSVRESLQSCLDSRAHGRLPAHGRFLYPRSHGYGEVWRRMGEALGEGLVTSCPISRIDLDARCVNGRWYGDTIINTIPWSVWLHGCDMPEDVRKAIRGLRHASIDVDYVDTDPGSNAHWIYDPDERLPYHRLLLRNNFCTGARGYWTETNASRSVASSGWRHHNEYGYPINTIGKQALLETIHAWASSRGVFPVGRWGRWEHMNSDIAVAEALQAADKITRPEPVS
jgi:protoporphyrinogen oxidase